MKTIVELFGGLGNQFFQYAFGLWRTGCHPELLTLDLSAFRKIHNRQASIMSVLKMTDVCLIDTGYYDFYGMKIDVRSKPDSFIQELNEEQSGYWYSGYFQNYSYVKPVLKYISESYHSVAMSKNHYSAAAFWSQDESVLRCAVHVRRGDYLHPSVQNIHGLVSSDLLLHVAKVQTKLACSERGIRRAQILLFSDDFNHEPSISCSMRLKKMGICPSQAMRMEFFLMTQADILICSNSTFGYWAGLLNNRKNKKIFIPDKWMRNGSIASESLLGENIFLYESMFESV